VQLLRLDRGRRLRPVAIQSERGQELLRDVPEELRLASAHAVGPDGAVHSGGDAIPLVARALPFGVPVALVAGLVPALTRSGYRLVAGNRMRLGRLVSADRRARADAALARRDAP
jgi:predicted DCC family thiol-disulfide oxidoreductase YuxK